MYEKYIKLNILIEKRCKDESGGGDGEEDRREGGWGSGGVPGADLDCNLLAVGAVFGDGANEIVRVRWVDEEVVWAYCLDLAYQQVACRIATVITIFCHLGYIVCSTPAECCNFWK